jgi:hypothetical protein
MVDDSERIHVELYPFSYFDEVRRRWLRARYLATLEEIRDRYQQFRIEGPPEVRDAPKDSRILDR